VALALHDTNGDRAIKSKTVYILTVLAAQDFPTLRWLPHTGEVGKSISFGVKFFQDFPCPKSLKSVNFWQSYSKI